MDTPRPLRIAIGILTFLLAAGCTPGPPGPSTRITSAHRLMANGAELYGHGCYARAGRSFARAYEIYALSASSTFMAKALNNSGNAYRKLRRFEEAEILYTDALGLAVETETPFLSDTIRINRAKNRMDLGWTIGARQDLSSLSVSSPAAIRARTLHMERVTGRTEAIRFLRKANLEDSASRFLLGRLLLDSGNPSEATVHLEAAAREDRNNEQTANLASDLEYLGLAKKANGDMQGAFEVLVQSAEISSLMALPEAERRHTQSRELARTLNLPATARLLYITRWREGASSLPPCNNPNLLPTIGKPSP